MILFKHLLVGTVCNWQCQDTCANIVVRTQNGGKIVADPPANKTSPSSRRKYFAGHGLDPKYTDVIEQSPAVFPRVWVSLSERDVIRRDKITLIKMKLDDNAPRAQLWCYSNELLFSRRSARL